MQFRGVLAHQARRGGRARRAARIARTPALGADVIEHPFDIRLDEGPGALVLGLLLAPDELGVREAAQLLDERARRERIELFDAQQVDVVRCRGSRAPRTGRNRPCPSRARRAAIWSSGTSWIRSLAPICAWSQSTRWNVVPGPKSSSLDTTRLWRSSDFGVIRISGLRKPRCSWRRRMWK